MRYVEVPICKSLHYLLQHVVDSSQSLRFAYARMRISYVAYVARSDHAASACLHASCLPLHFACLAWQVEFRKAFRKAALQI